MKPQVQLAAARAPDGTRLTLHAHDRDFVIRVNGHALMHSAAGASEELLGDLVVECLAAAGSRRDAPPKGAKVLLGGLGLGITLRRVLARLPAGAKVEVAELVPDVVAWNREWLTAVNGAALADPRVTVRVGDVAARLASAASYAVIALDVDNGPAAMVSAGNASLYGDRGLARLSAALRPGGGLLVWSAGPDRAFERRLAAAGFADVRAVPASTTPRARGRGHVIFVARRGA
jgi:spermidine synthase